MRRFGRRRSGSKVSLVIGMLALACYGVGCIGYSSTDNELVGQPKKVLHQTPIVCDERYDLDMSLGVMRDGVGSMSQQDVVLTVPNSNDVKTLTKAVADGKLVRVRYDIKRFVWCWNDHIVRSVEVVDTTTK